MLKSAKRLFFPAKSNSSRNLIPNRNPYHFPGNDLKGESYPDVPEMNQRNLTMSQQSLAGSRCPPGAALSPYLQNLMAEFKPRKDFDISIHTDGFKPEEINIEVNEDQGRLMVKAQHDHISKEGMVTTKQIVKSYDLPKGCKFEDLSSRYSPETGMLSISNKHPQIIRRDDTNILHENMFPSSPSCEEVHDGDDSFEIKINTNGFSADDLKVAFDPEGHLLVSGAITMQSKDSIMSRQIHRKFTIPRNCIIEKMEKEFSVGFLQPSEGGDLSPPDLPTPQAHEDTRCRCVCPNLSVLLVNITQKVVLPQRQIYVQSGVVPSECRCDQVVSPKVLEDPMIASHVKLHQINEKFCPRCVCKSETRNTTVIKIVVIFISFVIGVLSLYMGFLFCLDPWMKRNKQLYHMQTNEEINLDSFHLQGPSRRRDSDDTSTRPRGPGQEQVMLAVRSNPGSVLHRVGHQQSKWQRTVQEQRRNIYDRRAILN
ncbi:hypothetical protein TCAL_07926 [Tigriopus californicus]|uniref:SHSP domain-containing protein n=1 Tax=Tigriopus californicus TaxID=6832 RepID=A0A553PGA2_TIGCA|nr:hypothetical protein TCAL_07926 [Tigriopus californicus]